MQIPGTAASHSPKGRGNPWKQAKFPRHSSHGSLRDGEKRCEEGTSQVGDWRWLIEAVHTFHDGGQRFGDVP